MKSIVVLFAMNLLNSNAFGGIEEFRLPTYDADETTYFLSNRSNLDGTCKMLTSEAKATAKAVTFTYLNFTMTENEGAHPYQLAIVDVMGNIAGFKKYKNGLLNKSKVIESIHCDLGK